MNITIVEAARSSALTTLARVKGELGIALSDTSKDDRLEAILEEVSSAIVGYCHREFARQSVIEKQVGQGRTVQVLSLTPIVSLLEGATFDGYAIDDDLLSITDPGAGFIHLVGRFLNTRPRDQGITVEETNQPGIQAYAFPYVGGYILPGDDISASGTCTAAAADNSFNLAGDTFPILVSGEYVRVAGFATAGNNGRFRVLSRAEQKLIVGSTLVDESPSGVVTIRSRNLPREIEAWAVYEIRDRYLMANRSGAGDVTSERIGDWAATYATPGAENFGLSARTAAGLTSWIRVE